MLLVFISIFTRVALCDCLSGCVFANVVKAARASRLRKQFWPHKNANYSERDNGVFVAFYWIAEAGDVLRLQV